MIAEVVFNLPLERSFHYLIPEPLAPGAQPGVRVRAPFGPRELTGFIVRRLEESPIQALKPLRRLLDPSPVLSQDHWALAGWLTRYYGCSLGEALGAMVPSALRLKAGELGRAAIEPGAPPLRLTAKQEAAFAAIRRALAGRRFQTLLIHGVTGSGKTELYLQAADLVLRQGRSAIVLIPEIALSPQMLDRFRERFGEAVAAWHSRLTARQRAQAWAGMAAGRHRLVVGARSAVFAPLPRVGVIILDEEHDGSYKQDDAPRYHAREVAQARARLSRALVLLGSATPSIESYYAATHGRGTLVTLPERVEGRAMPATDIVDLREAWAARRAGVFSPHLERALEQTVARGEQAMLLLNRRGFARVAQCPACGAVVRCRRCAVPLIYHAARQALACHYCSFQEPPPEMCPACRKGYLRLRGAGTERVESELHRLFPTAAISRMDLDTMRGRDRHREVYEAVKQRRVGVLVGTQMIAKGLDFPQVTLVGIVSADTELNLPDFRAGERTFDLLTQMAGRAGRGTSPGRVLIQTYCPGHYAIRAAARHDYAGFYAEEIAMRRRLRLPPFTHLVELTLRGSPLRRIEAAASALAQALRRGAAKHRLTLLGPAPHRVARVRGAYQICVLLKGPRVEPLVQAVRQALHPGRKFQGLPVRVDVDPL